MKVIHIESGLGNQMLSYCEYIALKKIHPNEPCYIETIVYEISEADNYICQWNGFELDRIFGVDALNVKTLFSDEQWDDIINEITRSEFWKKQWNYPPYIIKALEHNGLSLNNKRGDFEFNKPEYSIASKEQPPISYRIKQTGMYANFRRIVLKYRFKKKPYEDKTMLFYSGDENVFTGQRLTFKNRNNNIEFIDTEIRSTFKFPPLTEEKNIGLANELKNANSVAIHARRGDMLSVNGKYYRSGYFRRAVKYIKKRVKNPVFYFFCDPGSADWCKDNLRIFGLSAKKDGVCYVDWNAGESSFRDMQLMSMCKHNIITNSSFGWWGAYLNENPEKITISPEIQMNTTVHL